MAHTPVEAFEAILNPFKLDNTLSHQLSVLTNVPEFNLLKVYMEGLAHSAPDLFTYPIIKIVIEYLQSKQAILGLTKEAKEKALAEILLISTLKKINHFINLLAGLQPRALQEVCDCLIEGDSGEKLLRGVSDLVLLPRIINKLVDASPNQTLSVRLAQINEKTIRDYANILEKLDFFSIPVTQIDAWSEILSLDESWFAEINQTNTLLKMLDERLLTPFGLSYILKFLKPSEMELDLIWAINRVVDVYIPIENKNSREAWQLLAKIFSLNSQSIFENIRKVYQLIVTISGEEIEPKHLKFLVTFLYEHEQYFRSGDFSLHVKRLSKLNRKLFSQGGLKLYQRIERLGYDIDDDYIEAFNKILATKPLEYISLLESLSDSWLTTKGLNKLSKVAEKYFTPIGIKFISSLDVESIDDEAIKAINDANREAVFAQFSAGPRTGCDIPNVMRLNKLKSLINSLKQKVGENTQSTVESSNQNAESLSLEMRRNKVDSLMTGECFVSYYKFISLVPNEDESPIFIITDKECITFENLNKYFCFIKYGSDLQICVREYAIKKIGTKDFFDLNTTFTQESIIDFSERNFDLEYLKKCLFEDKDLEFKISYFEQLMNSSQLAMIPEVLFNRDCELLATLDLSFLRNQILFKILLKSMRADATLQDINALNAAAPTLLTKFISFDEPRLNLIPLAFFSENLGFLVAIDPAYLASETMLILLDKFTKQELNGRRILTLNNEASYWHNKLSGASPAIISELHEDLFVEDRLKNLDSRYITNLGMYTFFKRFTKNVITDEDIIALNLAADVMFNKFIKHANMAAILESLPEKYFDRAQFTPNDFALIPENWLESTTAIEILKNFSKDIQPIDFKEGVLMTARRDIEFPISTFPQFKTVDDFFKVYGNDELLVILKNHSNHERFPTLLEHSVRFFDARFIPYLKNEANDYTETCRKLYRFACLRAEENKLKNITTENFPAEVLEFLRLKTKNSLIFGSPSDSANKIEKLEEFKNLANILVKNLQNNLEKFKKDHLKVDNKGELTTDFLTKESRLIAYKALVAAIEKGEIAFSELLITISEQDSNIGFSEPKHWIVGLQKYTQDFSALAREYISKYYTAAYKECLTDEYKMRLALLDDLFFELLPQYRPIEIAKTFPKMFFEVMNIYRPIELDRLRNDADGWNFKQLELESNQGISSRTEGPSRTSTLSPKRLIVDPPSFRLSNGGTATPSATVATMTSSTPKQNGTPVLTNGVKRSEMEILKRFNSASSHSSLPQSKEENTNHTRSSFPQASLRRIERAKFEYQLLDTDINAGLNLLVNEFELSPNLENGKAEEVDVAEHVEVNQSKKLTTGEKPKSHNMPFEILPVGVLTQTYSDSILESIQEYTSENKGKICYGIMNTNNNHFISIFVYTPLEGKGPTQVLILDPAFNTNEKSKNIKKIEQIFNNKFPTWVIHKSPFITQQFNDSDCGICCLQNAEDLFTKGLVTIEGNKLVFHRQKLTLDGESYIGKELAFESLTMQVRTIWEERLSRVKKISIHFISSTMEIDDYSFEVNKQVSAATLHGNGLLSKITSNFISSRSNDISMALTTLESNAIPTFEGDIKRLIQDFMQDEAKTLCEEYKKVAEKVVALNQKYQSEVITSFLNDTVEARLLEIVKRAHRENNSDFFKVDFIAYLKATDLLEDVKDVEKLRHHYTTFCSVSTHGQWIAAYEARKEWDHFEHVKEQVADYLKANNRSSRAKLFGFGNSLNNRIGSQGQDLTVPRAPVTVSILSMVEEMRAQQQAQQSTKESSFLSRFMRGSQQSQRVEPPKPTQDESATTQDLQAIFTRSKNVGMEKDEQAPALVRTASSPDLTSISPRRLSNNIEWIHQSTKLFIGNILEELESNLKSYKPASTAGFASFFGESAEHKLVKSLVEKCEGWMLYFRALEDLNLINQQIYFIARELFTIVRANPTLLGSENTPTYLIKLPLARLVGVSDIEIQNYNTGEKITLPVRPAKDKPIVPTTRPGYDFLLHAIEKNFVAMKVKYNISDEDVKDLSLLKPIMKTP